MIFMIKMLIALFLLGLSSLSASGRLEERYRQSANTQKFLSTMSPDVLLKSANVALHIYFFGKGTEQEGFHGVLYRDGEELKASSNLFKFQHYYLKYYGDIEERIFTSSRSGWLPRNLKRIPPAGTVRER